MESDQVFTADAILDQPSSTSSPLYNRRRGHDAMQSAVGGIESQKITDYEDSPLLSRDNHRDYSAGRLTPDEDEDRPLPTWSGERDHEGKPWWKTPSVRAKQPYRKSTFADVCDDRCSGFCHRF